MTTHTTALRASFLFDGTSSTLTANPMLIIENGIISAVHLDSAPIPDSAEVIDLPGATLMPGMIDTHVHLCFDASRDPLGRLAATDDDTLLELMADHAQVALRAGVTTVRDLGDRDYQSLTLRGATRFGPLPTIVAAGPPITTPGGHCHFLGGEANGLDEARAAVRDRVERGVDVIKIMASGGNMTPRSSPFDPQFGVAILRAVVDEAHRHGLAVTAHAHAAASVADAVEAGVDGIEHATFMTPDGVDAPEATLNAIAQRRIAVGATLGHLPDTGLEPPPIIASRMNAIRNNLRRLRDAGAVVVVGTDAGIAPVKPHDVLAYAPEQLDEIGMTPVEALWTVSSRAAAVCGLGHRKGRIAAGYDADILAITGDPTQHPSAVRNVSAVFAGGQRIPGAGDRAGLGARSRRPRPVAGFPA